MNEAIAAFVGAFAGSFLTLLFAGRTARAQAINQRWAERRGEVIEKLAPIISDATHLMDAVNGNANTPGRDFEQILGDLGKLQALSELYLSDQVRVALLPIGQWLYDVTDNGHDPQDGQPDTLQLRIVRGLLSEAIEGQHSRTTDFRRWVNRGKSTCLGRHPSTWEEVRIL
jgi:hypothetical protein